MFLCGLIVRLLTSAVMEGDRRDTAEFMDGAVFPPEADRSLWQKLLAKTESELKSLSSSAPINEARRKISDICREAADKPSGIYRLNVPTGGGKTLTALRYALAHSEKYNKKRIIFTFPLLSILDQNSSVIRKYVGSDYVLEHHSNVIQEKNSPEKLEEYELLTETWSSPIIVTTLVQLLNTMFDGKTSYVRRFHALTDAVIVIDEVQTVPGKMLSLFNLAISFLAGVCNTTTLLCSATQPCLEEMIHPIRTEIHDIVPYDPVLWEVFRRTDIRFAGGYRIDEIPTFANSVLADTDSLLIVCNKKSESEAIYHAMKNSDYNIYHLSASMCMEHRRKTLKDLQNSLENTDKKTVCVATQVIEAGVDISFGAVVRLTAGMDSIIQSAGRCNRHGESDQVAPVYIVRALDENMSHLQEIRMAQQATESLLDAYEASPEEYGSDLSSNKAIHYYYKRLFRNQYGSN
ncbi:MAG: CRISPR-associated helicase Cas3', partial [Clostridia bacterium]|nr:CRISPR-associated helicase Cas3' [Clostridia bacterium]